MYVPFNELPPNARIWIYQSAREFTEAETAKLQQEIQDFVTAWSAHGKQLLASGGVFHNRFIVLAADEAATQPSGCSIDSSVQFIRSVEAGYNTSLFDRTQLAFRLDDGIITMPLSRLKEAVSAGKIKPETVYFDNLITRAEEVNSAWLKPAQESWLRKYF